MSDYIRQHAVAIDYKLDESWDISINYGIKTGLNEAFIISKEKRDELIKADPKSAEIIRPILRGRDIKRYSINFANLYLIYVPWHFPLQNNPSIVGASKEAESLFKKGYPAIYNHLYQYKDKLSKRNRAETGKRYEWYALQRYGAKYMDDFSKQKLAWNRIASKKVFGLVPKEIYIQDSIHFITGEHIEYLTAVLNSSLFIWLMNTIVGSAAGGNAGNSDNVKELVIIKPSEEIENKIIEYLKNNDAISIDKLIYNMYSLTSDEIGIISATLLL